MRKFTILGCWLGLVLSVGATVLAVSSMLEGSIGEWENYQGQPMNSGLGIVVSVFFGIVCAVSLYKLHTNPKWDKWTNNQSLYRRRTPREKGERLPPPR